MPNAVCKLPTITMFRDRESADQRLCYIKHAGSGWWICAGSQANSLDRDVCRSIRLASPDGFASSKAVYRAYRSEYQQRCESSDSAPCAEQQSRLIHGWEIAGAPCWLWRHYDQSWLLSYYGHDEAEKTAFETVFHSVHFPTRSAALRAFDEWYREYQSDG